MNNFFSRRLLSHDKKCKLDVLTPTEEKIRYFLDTILIPGLDIDYTGHFDEMIRLMKDSDDILTRHLAEKLLVPNASAVACNTSSTPSPSIPLTTDKGNKNLICYATNLHRGVRHYIFSSM